MPLHKNRAGFTQNFFKIFIFSVTIITTIYYCFPVFLVKTENKLQTHLFSLKKKPEIHKDLIVIVIDDSSISSIEKFPLPVSEIQSAITFISHFQPKVLGILFPGKNSQNILSEVPFHFTLNSTNDFPLVIGVSDSSVKETPLKTVQEKLLFTKNQLPLGPGIQVPLLSNLPEIPPLYSDNFLPGFVEYPPAAINEFTHLTYFKNLLLPSFSLNIFASYYHSSAEMFNFSNTAISLQLSDKAIHIPVNSALKQIFYSHPQLIEQFKKQNQWLSFNALTKIKDKTQLQNKVVILTSYLSFPHNYPLDDNTSFLIRELSNLNSLLLNNFTLPATILEYILALFAFSLLQQIFSGRFHLSPFLGFCFILLLYTGFVFLILLQWNLKFPLTSAFLVFFLNFMQIRNNPAIKTLNSLKKEPLPPPKKNLSNPPVMLPRLCVFFCVCIKNFNERTREYTEEKRSMILNSYETIIKNCIKEFSPEKYQVYNDSIIYIWEIRNLDEYGDHPINAASKLQENELLIQDQIIESTGCNPNLSLTVGITSNRCYLSETKKVQDIWINPELINFIYNFTCELEKNSVGFTSEWASHQKISGKLKEISGDENKESYYILQN